MRIKPSLSATVAFILSAAIPTAAPAQVSVGLGVAFGGGVAVGVTAGYAR